MGPRATVERGRARAVSAQPKKLVAGIITTLVADVTDAYFFLQTLDRQLLIARGTRDVAADGLRLTQLRRERGVATALDTRQAEQLLYTATAQIASLERQIAQTEDALSLLLGRAPGDVMRTAGFIDTFNARPAVPVGLPSALLERRPDIRQAEQALVAANAQIGVARAEYFPRIALTGLLGLDSRELSDLLTAPARTASIGAFAAAPLFNAGPDPRGSPALRVRRSRTGRDLRAFDLSTPSERSRMRWPGIARPVSSARSRSSSSPHCAMPRGCRPTGTREGSTAICRSLTRSGASFEASSILPHSNGRSSSRS